MNAGGVALFVAIQSVAALSVFFHAMRERNRYAILWGLATLIFIAAALIYAARVWWNRGGKEYFRPR